MLPTAITIMPARKKRVPAKRIRDAKSPSPMAKSAYPILMDGEADPHRKQQKNAKRKTAKGLVQKTPRSFTDPCAAVVPF